MCVGVAESQRGGIERDGVIDHQRMKGQSPCLSVCPEERGVYLQNETDAEHQRFSMVFRGLTTTCKPDFSLLQTALVDLYEHLVFGQYLVCYC